MCILVNGLPSFPKSLQNQGDPGAGREVDGLRPRFILGGGVASSSLMPAASSGLGAGGRGGAEQLL